MTPTLIMKFGGASVQTPAHIRAAAALIATKRQSFSKIVVVVSAMGEATDDLLALAHAMQEVPLPREKDMLVSVGERVTMSLLAMALAEEGIEAVSFTGSQSGIITDEAHAQAKILSVQPWRIQRAFSEGKIAIVAGFQGVSQKGEITTLGRGGSDTSAVALAIALEAKQVEFYKDVAGIYPANPKKKKNLIPFSTLSFEKTLEILAEGAEVLERRAAVLAQKNGMPLLVRKYSSPDEGGTEIGGESIRSVKKHYEGAFSPSSLVLSGIADRLSHRFSKDDLPKIYRENKRHVLACFHKEHTSRFLQKFLSPTLFFHTTFQLGDQLVDYFEFETEAIYLEKDLVEGAGSLQKALRLLEWQGGSKEALVREKMALFIDRFPRLFEFDLTSEMEQFFAQAKETYTQPRTADHQEKIITTLYFLRKKLEQKWGKREKARHVMCKLRTHYLSSPFGPKEVLGVYVFFNFLKEHEVFDEKHLLLAISQLIPGVQSVPESFYELRGEETKGVYLEIENGDKALLKEKLAELVGRKIKRLVPPVFMPRNEEEVMQGLILLSREIKYTKDIPQMMIAFEEQTESELIFRVILVRIQNEGAAPLKELFPQFHFDRVRTLGMLRGRHAKEGAVMRAHLPSDAFLRDDFSVDLPAARQQISTVVENVLGPVRDFNGGMIAKQRENFEKFSSILPERKEIDLQNFFHAISPSSLSAIAAPERLAKLYLLFEEAAKAIEPVWFRFDQEDAALIAMIKTEDFEQRRRLFHKVEALEIPSSELLHVQIEIYDAFFLGFVYLSGDRDRQNRFLDTLPEALVCNIYG